MINRDLEFLVSDEQKEHIKKKVIIQKNQFLINNHTKKLFYESELWKQIRFYILSNYVNECSFCKSTKSLQIDHIRPLSTYPSRSLKLVNLQILCKECNLKKSNLSRKRYGMIKKPNWRPFHIYGISKRWQEFFPKIK